MEYFPVLPCIRDCHSCGVVFVAIYAVGASFFLLCSCKKLWTSPNGTFGTVQEFHSKFYHPSNARIWFYGDDDPNQRLRTISGEFSMIPLIDIFLSI